MNREIEFRRIHRHIKSDKILLTRWGFRNGSFVAPKTISGYETLGDKQFTGLKDKNGTKIFEGDAVDFEEEGVFGFVDHLHLSTKRRGYVDFADASFRIIDGIGVRHYRWMDYEVEKIGTIHENPELLTQNHAE